MTNFDKLTIFINRLKKLGIVIELFGNYPWIYLGKINGKNVIEKFEAEHGFTIAFLPIKPEKELQFTDTTEIFKLIRKYLRKPPKDGCSGYKDYLGDFDCGYDTIIDCEDCIYTKHGRKNPQAKINQRKS